MLKARGLTIGLVAAGVVILAAAAVIRYFAAEQLGKRMNRLLERAAWGHHDLPRRVEGNVALQVFTIVTRSPVPRPCMDYPGERCVSVASPNVTALLGCSQTGRFSTPDGRTLEAG